MMAGMNLWLVRVVFFVTHLPGWCLERMWANTWGIETRGWGPGDRSRVRCKFPKSNRGATEQDCASDPDKIRKKKPRKGARPNATHSTRRRWERKVLQRVTPTERMHRRARRAQSSPAATGRSRAICALRTWKKAGGSMHRLKWPSHVNPSSCLLLVWSSRRRDPTMQSHAMQWTHTIHPRLPMPAPPRPLADRRPSFAWGGCESVSRPRWVARVPFFFWHGAVQRVGLGSIDWPSLQPLHPELSQPCEREP
ncbi:hypothetical protein B0T16DRAFT_11492 [Cercophora newfieldiana]|uniref:Secreted protein n=1 Tax=Cercophora newfieldiana TaxID=92897 RepID=A0AA39YMV4_9PEZI|nr:hypothetical protein B0T16DRAFT_11492 [Cercophora newfieldiana]